jgi:multidrug resistance efflux pump
MRFRQFPVGTLIGHPWQSRAIIDRLNPDFKTGKAERGDLLIQLDPRGYEVNLASAVAKLESAQSKLTEAQQNVAQAGSGRAKADLAS